MLQHKHMAQKPCRRMVRVGALTHGSLARYKNKVYYIFRDKYSETRLSFIEYHVWNLTRDTYKRDFELDIERGEYADHQTKEAATRHQLYKKVLHETVLVEPEDIDATYIDCLNALYTQAITGTISVEEKSTREALHVGRLKEYLKDTWLRLVTDLYTCAAKGHNYCTVHLKFPESALTNYGELPILSSHPCSDGIQRSSYKEYVSYIFFKAFCSAQRSEALRFGRCWEHRIGSGTYGYPPLQEGALPVPWASCGLAPARRESFAGYCGLLGRACGRGTFGVTHTRESQM